MLSQEIPTSRLPWFGEETSFFPEPDIGMYAPQSRSVTLQPASHSTVLIVEDDAVSRRTLSRLLSAHGYSAESTGSAEEALKRIDRDGAPRLALVDLDLPGMDGLEFINRLGRLDPSVTPVLVTAAGEDDLVAALHERDIAYLRKPIDFGELLALMSRIGDGGRVGNGVGNGNGYSAQYTH